MRFASSLIQALAFSSLLLYSTFLLSLPGQAVVEAVLSNDICANAAIIAIGSTIKVNTTLATSASDGDCYNDIDSTRPGVWYTFVGTDEKFIVESCPSDSWITIFSGGCNSTTHDCVLVTNDSCSRDQLVFFAQSGTTYHLLFQSPYEGLFDLSLFPAPRRTLIAVTFGDPHIVTTGGFSSIVKPGATTSGIGTSASVTSGIVINESNASSIQISFESKNANTVQGCFDLVKLYVSREITPLISGASYTNVSVTILNNEEIVIMYNSGLEIHLLLRASSAWGCYLTQWIVLPERYRPNENITGLLGNANNDASDDWQTKLGVTLPIPVFDESFFQAEYDYCRTEWCVHNVTDSLFTYGPGESFAMYYECDVPYDSELVDAIGEASPELVEACHGYTFLCLLDSISGTAADAQNFILDFLLVDKIFSELDHVTSAPSPKPTITPSRKPSQAPTLKPTTAPNRNQLQRQLAN